MSWETLAVLHKTGAMTINQEAEEKVTWNTDSTEVAAHFVILKKSVTKSLQPVNW